MWRVLGFFVLAVLLASVLGHVPIVGGLFRNTGILGILVASALISAALTRLGDYLMQGRKLRSELRSLEAVGNAHNHGKIGTLYLTRGRARGALGHLEQAARGESEVPEWHYRLGLARLATRDVAGALGAFERCVALEEEHAYGSAMMRRAESLHRLGRHDEALAVLALQERNHGPSPEVAFRRGLALRALRRRAEARAAFDEVGALARRATHYQRRSAALWALRASFVRFV